MKDKSAHKALKGKLAGKNLEDSRKKKTHEILAEHAERKLKVKHDRGTRRFKMN